MASSGAPVGARPPLLEPADGERATERQGRAQPVRQQLPPPPLARRADGFSRRDLGDTEPHRLKDSTGQQEKRATGTQKRTADPEFGERFRIDLTKGGQRRRCVLKARVVDPSTFGADELLGHADIGATPAASCPDFAGPQGLATLICCGCVARPTSGTGRRGAAPAAPQAAAGTPRPRHAHAPALRRQSPPRAPALADPSRGRRKRGCRRDAWSGGGGN